jgi:hypothetical protein
MTVKKKKINLQFFETKEILKIDFDQIDKIFSLIGTPQKIILEVFNF